MSLPHRVRRAAKRFPRSSIEPSNLPATQSGYFLDSGRAHRPHGCAATVFLLPTFRSAGPQAPSRVATYRYASSSLGGKSEMTLPAAFHVLRGRPVERLDSVHVQTMPEETHHVAPRRIVVRSRREQMSVRALVSHR